ncbi:MAG: NAD-dependent epimerase/dehydratase family protein [Marinilabiliales bacterium]
MIILTGGTGFLGSHLLYHLLSNNYNVLAICRANSSKKQTEKIFNQYQPDNKDLFNSIKWHECDLNNYYDVVETLSGAQGVIHAAALVSYNPADKNRLLKENVNITKNIVDASLINNIQRFLHVSSIAALGETKDSNKLIDENVKWSEEDVNSGYSVSKYYAELEVWRGIAEGLNAVIVNPSVILGYGDWDKGSCALFKTIYNGFKYYTLGSSGFIYVEDVCKIIIKLFESNISGEQFVLSSENKTYKEIFYLIAEALNVNPPRKYATPFLTGIAWRLEYVKSKLSRSAPLITRESAINSHKLLKYSNDKIQGLLQYDYTKIDNAVKLLADKFLKEQ